MPTETKLIASDSPGHSACSRRALVGRSTSLVLCVLAVGLALSPLSDYLSVRSSYRASAAGADGHYSLYLRGLFLFTLVVVMLMRGTVSVRSFYIGFLAIFGVAGATVMYQFDTMSTVEYVQEAMFMMKAFAFFIFFAGFSSLDDDDLERLEPLVTSTLLAYTLAIIAGAVFSIDMFRSYWGDTQIRSGYKGIIYAQNETSALVISGLAYSYLSVLTRGWRHSTRLLVGTLILSSFLVGTKAGFAGQLGVTGSFFIARYRPLAAAIRIAWLTAALALAIWLAYMAIPSVRAAVELSYDYFVYHHDHATGGKMATVLLSGRNLKFATVMEGVARLRYVNLLIGGYPVVRYMIEIDIPDLVLVLGAPACLIYLWMMSRIFFCNGRGAVPRFGCLTYLLIIATACTAGHVLVSAVIAPYFALVGVQLQRSARAGSAVRQQDAMEC